MTTRYPFRFHRGCGRFTPPLHELPDLSLVRLLVFRCRKLTKPSPATPFGWENFTVRGLLQLPDSQPQWRNDWLYAHVEALLMDRSPETYTTASFTVYTVTKSVPLTVYGTHNPCISGARRVNPPSGELFRCPPLCIVVYVSWRPTRESNPDNPVDNRA